MSIPTQGRQRFKLSTPDGRQLTDREGDRALALEMAAELSEHLRSEAYEREQQRLAARTTVKDFGELWTSGKLLERYGEVRGLKDKKSVSDDKYRLAAYVYPHIGLKAVADVTEQDIERTMARAAAAAEKKLGRPWRQATKFQVYQLMRRGCPCAAGPA